MGFATTRRVGQRCEPVSGCGAGEARDEGEELRHRAVGWVEVRAGSEACPMRCKVEEEREYAGRCSRGWRGGWVGEQGR